MNEIDQNVAAGEIIDVEEYAKAGREAPAGVRCRWRIRIDREKYVVEVARMTGSELLILAGKTPPERFKILQKLHGGQVEEIGLDEYADFTPPGVERFVTLPLDQTEG